MPLWNTALSVCGMVSLPKNFRPLSGAQNLCRMWWQSSPASRRRSESGGMEPLAALEAFLAFVGKDTLVGYHLKFDLDFLRAAGAVLAKAESSLNLSNTAMLHVLTFSYVLLRLRLLLPLREQRLPHARNRGQISGDSPPAYLCPRMRETPPARPAAPYRRSRSSGVMPVSFATTSGRGSVPRTRAENSSAG